MDDEEDDEKEEIVEQVMTKFVDDREGDMIPIAQARGYTVAHLEVGDYQYGTAPNNKSNIVVERKSDDLFSFDRLFAQLKEIKESGMSGHLVVDKPEIYFRNKLVASGRSKRVLVGLKVSLAKRGFHPYFSFSQQDFFDVVETIFEKETDGKDRDLVDKFRKKVSKEEVFLRILTTFKGVSMETGEAILKAEIGADLLGGLRGGFTLPYLYPHLDNDTLLGLGLGGKGAVMEAILKFLETGELDVGGEEKGKRE